MTGKKIKLEEEAIGEVLVAETASELGAEASNVVEDYFEEEEEQQQQQQQQASVEVAITNTGQRTRLRCHVFSRQEKGHSAPEVTALCVVPCFAEYHAKVKL
jgi:hypothetical protein